MFRFVGHAFRQVNGPVGELSAAAGRQVMRRDPAHASSLRGWMIDQYVVLGAILACVHVTFGTILVFFQPGSFDLVREHPQPFTVVHITCRAPRACHQSIPEYFAVRS